MMKPSSSSELGLAGIGGGIDVALSKLNVEEAVHAP
jgi:hypothetical protein